VSGRRRLDADLVRRGLVTTRTEAQSLIDDHRVLVNGAVADKAARQVAPGDQVVVSGPPPRFVGRGGLKLEHALEVFSLEVSGLRGHGQLHERLRDDPRVTNLERTNIRTLDADRIGGPVDLVVADLSFISLRLVIDPLRRMCQPGSSMVLLVKPQFEAGRSEASRGRGVISDPIVWQRVRGEVDDALVAAGCHVVAWTDSPVAGADGNREFLVHAVTPGTDSEAESSTVTRP
jgi:23S rRNA (cytidine1920-2'-O)/16S rRNA (cytidine1409-2'-O)-methyltransferase